MYTKVLVEDMQVGDIVISALLAQPTKKIVTEVKPAASYDKKWIIMKDVVTGEEHKQLLDLGTHFYLRKE